MDENLDRVKIRVRVKERIPDVERAPLKKRRDITLWIIATVVLGACLGYLIADQLLSVFRSPGVSHAPPDEMVIKAAKEKMVLEHEDLVSTPTPEPAPEG